MNVTTKSFRDFCPKCAYYQEQTGVCTKIFENVREYPKKFIKKCNGDYFTYDSDKLGDAVEMEDPNAKTEKNEFNQIQTSAGFWVRSGSVILDGLILLLISAFFLSLVIVPFSPIIPVETYLKFVFIFSPLFFLFYLAWINADGRHSPGKMLFGLAVVNTSYKRISFSRSLRRTLASFFDLPGLLFILLNRKRQTLHDMLAKTYVIRVNQPQRLEKLLIVVIVIGGSYLASVLSRYIDSYTQAFRIPTASENRHEALIASEAHFEIKFMKTPEVSENLVQKIDKAIYQAKMAAKSKGSFQNQNIPSKSDSVLGIGLNSGLLFDTGGYQHPLLNNLANYLDRNDGTVIFLVIKSRIDSVKALLYSNYGKNYPELNQITRDIVGTNTDILLGNTKLKKLRRFYTLNFCEIESILSDKFISEAKIEYRLQVLPQFKYEPIIKIRLDETGTKEWKRITSENIGKRIAVILNNNWVYDTNVISKIDTTGEIEFSGLRSNSEAERLALALNKKHQNH